MSPAFCVSPPKLDFKKNYSTSLKAKLLSPSGQDQSWEISLRFTGIKTWIFSTNRLLRRNENLILTDGSKVFY